MRPPNACERCKRRHHKCNVRESKSACARCVKDGEECRFVYHSKFRTYNPSSRTKESTSQGTAEQLVGELHSSLGYPGMLNAQYLVSRILFRTFFACNSNCYYNIILYLPISEIVMGGSELTDPTANVISDVPITSSMYDDHPEISTSPRDLADFHGLETSLEAIEPFGPHPDDSVLPTPPQGTTSGNEQSHLSLQEHTSSITAQIPILSSREARLLQVFIYRFAPLVSLTSALIQLLSVLTDP